MRTIFREARSETSAREATLTFLAQDDQAWVLLVKAPESEELAIRIEQVATKSPAQIQREIRSQLMRLF